MKTFWILALVIVPAVRMAQAQNVEDQIQDARVVTSDAVGRQDLPHLFSGDISTYESGSPDGDGHAQQTSHLVKSVATVDQTRIDWVA